MIFVHSPKQPNPCRIWSRNVNAKCPERDFACVNQNFDAIGWTVKVIWIFEVSAQFSGVRRMQNSQCTLRRKCLERGSSHQNLQVSVTEITGVNKIFELLALVPSRFDKKQAIYDFLKFAYQMKIARFSSKLRLKNKILVLNYEESDPEL